MLNVISTNTVQNVADCMMQNYCNLYTTHYIVTAKQ